MEKHNQVHIAGLLYGKQKNEPSHFTLYSSQSHVDYPQVTNTVLELVIFHRFISITTLSLQWRLFVLSIIRVLSQG